MFETVSRETVYEGFTTIRVDRLRGPDGDEFEREVAVHDSAVAIVPLFADGTVVLLRQYRHAVGQYVLEIPAGKLDVEGESASDAAQRELIEETGLKAERLEHLTTFLNSAGWNTERTTIYAGYDLTEQAPPDDFSAEHEEADMEVVRLPLDEAVGAVHDGTITDAKTVIGLLLVAPRS